MLCQNAMAGGMSTGLDVGIVAQHFSEHQPGEAFLVGLFKGFDLGGAGLSEGDIVQTFQQHGFVRWSDVEGLTKSVGGLQGLGGEIDGDLDGLFPLHRRFQLGQFRRLEPNR